MRNMKEIRALVGNVTEEQLKYVDCYVCNGFGIFVPSVGFCGYATQQQHTHPSYSAVIIPPGCQSAGIMPQKFPHDKNCYLAGLLSPYIPHEEVKQDTFQRYFALMISEERFERTCLTCEKEIPQLSDWRQFSIPRTIISWINYFMRECESDAAEQPEISSHWASLITFELIRNCFNKTKSKTFSPIPDTTIEDVRQYLHQNYHLPLTISDLSKQANMSESNFNRTFKQETGQTPAKYLHMIRLEKARKLLCIKEYSVTDTALACGFSDVSHFSKRFKEAYDLSPTAFKNSCL